MACIRELFEPSVDVGSVIDALGAGVYTVFVWAAGDAPIASHPTLHEGQDAS